MSIWTMKEIYDGRNTPIVNSGLTLHLDAGKYASYPGSGATWTDLSGNGNHMTLVNSPAWSASNGGILQFNGTNQSGSNSMNYATSTFTIMVASRWSGTPKGRIISSTSTNWLFGHHAVGAEAYYAQGWISATTGLPNDTNWRIFTGVEDYTNDLRSFYVNNVAIVTNSTAGAGGFNGLTVGSTALFPAEISQCEVGFILVYNRILTRAEISQNFYAHRERFGL